MNLFSTIVAHSSVSLTFSSSSLSLSTNYTLFPINDTIMLSYFVKVAVLATLAAAQCDPTPPTTTAGPGPTGGSGTTTVIHPNGNNGKCVDVDGANFSNGSKIQMWVERH